MLAPHANVTMKITRYLHYTPLLTPPVRCHPDRSAAKWRDLRLLLKD